MTRKIGRRSATATMVAAVTAALLVGGFAFAATRAGGGAAEKARASFDLDVVGSPDTRICAQRGGSYEMTTATYAGPVTGTPSLMNGRLTFTLTIVLNLDNKFGSVTGTWTLRDPSTNAERARGSVLADIPNGSDLDGFVSGNLSDSPRALYGALFAVLAEDRSRVIGRIGDLTPPNRAVIVPTSPC